MTEIYADGSEEFHEYHKDEEAIRSKVELLAELDAMRHDAARKIQQPVTHEDYLRFKEINKKLFDGTTHWIECPKCKGRGRIIDQ